MCLGGFELTGTKMDDTPSALPEFGARSTELSSRTADGFGARDRATAMDRLSGQPGSRGLSLGPDGGRPPILGGGQIIEDPEVQGKQGDACLFDLAEAFVPPRLEPLPALFVHGL